MATIAKYAIIPDTKISGRKFIEHHFVQYVDFICVLSLIGGGNR